MEWVGSGRSSLVWFGKVGLDLFGLIGWSGSMYLSLVGLVWFGLVWFGLVWFGLVWVGRVWSDWI